MAENKLCRFGDKCTKGKKCPFVHSKKSDIALINPKPKIKCKDGENCKYLPNCRFDHSSSPMDQLTTAFQDIILVNEYVFSLF